MCEGLLQELLGGLGDIRPRARRSTGRHTRSGGSALRGGLRRRSRLDRRVTHLAEQRLASELVGLAGTQVSLRPCGLATVAPTRWTHSEKPAEAPSTGWDAPVGIPYCDKCRDQAQLVRDV